MNLAFWSKLDELVQASAVVMDRPLGSPQSMHSEIIYPLEFAWFPRVFPYGRLTVVSDSSYETDRIVGMTMDEFLPGNRSRKPEFDWALASLSTDVRVSRFLPARPASLDGNLRHHPVPALLFRPCRDAVSHRGWFLIPHRSAS